MPRLEALTDGFLLYVNQTQRTTWGGGLFQSLRFRVDRSLVEAARGQLPAGYLISAERFFGATGLARYPLSTFTFLESFAGRVVLYYLPWYFAFKSLFILWLQLPQFRVSTPVSTPHAGVCRCRAASSWD